MKLFENQYDIKYYNSEHKLDEEKDLIQGGPYSLNKAWFSDPVEVPWNKAHLFLTVQKQKHEFYDKYQKYLRWEVWLAEGLIPEDYEPMNVKKVDWTFVSKNLEKFPISVIKKYQKYIDFKYIFEKLILDSYINKEGKLGAFQDEEKIKAKLEYPEKLHFKDILGFELRALKYIFPKEYKKYSKSLIKQKSLFCFSKKQDKPEVKK